MTQKQASGIISLEDRPQPFKKLPRVGMMDSQDEVSLKSLSIIKNDDCKTAESEHIRENPREIVHYNIQNKLWKPKHYGSLSE